MKIYFDVTTKYFVPDEGGDGVKEISRKDIIQAVSYGDAEANAITIMNKILPKDSDFKIKDVKKIKISEILSPEALESSDAAYWLGKGTYQFEASKGKFKNASETILVSAETIQDATQQINKHWNGTKSTIDTTIVSVSRTAFNEVFLIEKTDLEKFEEQVAKNRDRNVEDQIKSALSVSFMNDEEVRDVTEILEKVRISPSIAPSQPEESGVGAVFPDEDEHIF